MKVLIIGSFDLFLLPFAKKYTAFFEEIGIDYSFIYWNRKDEPAEDDAHYIVYNCPMNTYRSPFLKLKAYMGFRKFALKEIRSGKYDRFVFLTSQAMILFANHTKKLAGKYIFDYRDETYERYGFYRRAITKCIRRSIATPISSPGFRRIFSDKVQDKFVLCHNTKEYPAWDGVHHPASSPLVVNFWGMIRHVDYFRAVNRVFGNDPDFVVNYYGEGFTEQLEEDIRTNGYENIHAHGKYVEADIRDFVSTTDLLLNCYPNDSIQMKALTVKLYEGIHYRLPMVIQAGSYMDTYMSEHNLPHISLDFEHGDPAELKTSLMEQYRQVQTQDMECACAKMEEEIAEDQRVFRECLSMLVAEDEERA